MPTTHFEKLIERAIDECRKAALNMTVGDSQETVFVHKHGTLKGRAEGLTEALSIFRQAHREDSEDGTS